MLVVNRKTWTGRLAMVMAVAGLAVGSAMSGSALGQAGNAGAKQGNDPAPAGEKAAPKPMQSFLAIEHAPLSDWFQDPKDAVLKRALGMFPDRLYELPREIPGMPEEAVTLIDSLSRMAVQPGRFAITYTPNFAAGGAMGYGVVLSSKFADKAKADAMEASILGLIHEKDPDFESTQSQRFPGLTEVVIPVAPLRFGSRDGKNGSSYDVIWGAVTDADAPFDALPKPTLGGKTIVNGTMNFQALGTIINFAQTGINGAMQNSGQAPVQLGRELAEWGLIGNEALTMHFESAYVDGATRSRVVMANVQKLVEQMGTEKGGLSAADLGAIPADATSASMTLISTKPLLKLIGALRARFEEGDEALLQFASRTGVDLEKDLLSSIGGVMGFYTSESTGGGGAGSMVAMMSFTNRAKFLAAHDKVIAAAKREILENAPPEAQMAMKYVRLRTWKSGGTDVMSVTFPGVPVPLEISYAATDRWFVVGLTPQAVVGALAQIEGKGDKGIATRADVMAQMPKGKEITSISFKDAPRSMRDGYTMTSMIGSAVANAMRSPHDAAREPGILVPSYRDLVKGARTTVQVSYRQGETIVVEGVSDGSMLVGMASALGDMNFIGPMMSAMSTMGQMKQMGGMRGMNFGAIPVPDKVALILRGVSSGPTAILSPEQWVLWTGVLAPEMPVLAAK